MNGNIINIQNPIPILEQPKSSITTNPLIPNKQKEIEYTITDKKESETLNKEYKEKQKNGIKYQSFYTIHSKISQSVIGILTELFDKPKENTISEHIINIFTKDQRYAYIGFLLVIISMIIYIIRPNFKREYRYEY